MEFFRRVDRQTSKFLCFLKTKQDGSPRRYFPKAQSLKFGRDLDEILRLTNSTDEFLKSEELVKLTSTLIVMSGFMKGMDGILAFSDLVDVILSLLRTFLNQHDHIQNLLLQNRELTRSVSQLEEDMEELESEMETVSLSSLKVSGSDELEDSFYQSSPLKDPESSYRMVVLNSMMDAILSAGQVVIHDIFIGRSDFDKFGESSSKVVVLHSGNSFPKTSEFVVWKNIMEKSCDEMISNEEDFNFDEFRINKPAEYSQLFHDFNDNSVFQLLKEHSDVVCVMPSVMKVGAELEPALLVKRKIRGYRPMGEAAFPETKLMLDCGKEVNIYYEYNWHFSSCMDSVTRVLSSFSYGSVSRVFSSSSSHSATTATSPVTFPAGISREGDLDKCGSLGGEVVDAHGSQFLVTCEHVFRKWEESSMVSNLAVKPKDKFLIPSPQNRKCILSQLSGRSSTNQLDNILSLHNSPSLVAAVRGQSAADAGSSVTLTEIHDFVYRNQQSIETDMLEIVTFSNEVEVVVGDTQIKVSGNVALIPILSTGFERDFAIGGYMPINWLETYLRTNHKLEVSMASANSGLNQGFISRLAHINTSAPVDHISETLKTSSDPPEKRTLINQLLVTGSNFGRPGDSGGLVFYFERREKIAVGVFLGALNSSRTTFVVTPAEFIVNNGFQYRGMHN